METKKKLGEILMGQGLINAGQLSDALEEQKKSKEPLGAVLLRLGFIKRETDILVALSQQLKLPILIGEQISPRVDQRLHYLVPEALARKQMMLPISRTETEITIAFAYTFDPTLLTDLKKQTGLEVSPVLVKKTDLDSKLDAFYKLKPLDAAEKTSQPVLLTKEIKATAGQKLKLGQILVRQGLITEEDLDQALVAQKKSGLPLGEVLIQLQLVQREADIMLALSQQLNIPLMVGDQLNPRADQRLKEVFPEAFSRDKLALPLFRSGRSLTVAFGKPFDFLLLDDLRKITGLEIVPVLAAAGEIEKRIQMFYGSVQLEEVTTGADMAAEIKTAARSNVEGRVELAESTLDVNQPPVIRFVDLLLKKAIEDLASDIHIEPYEDRLIVRCRIDGILYELPPPPRQLHLAVVSRIKILSRLDIAEKRIPQDGSFSINFRGRAIDIRVSTIPVVFGERVVMRLLDKAGGIKSLSELGFELEELRRFQNAIQKPYGLIFVTGPTGSGKSTTLYAAINYIKSTETNILTIEDPVEYQMSGIGQVQVKPDIGLTFASGLRAFLRQDPDVILVGEVRDEETADVCIRAALTGHLVLSTLHTNDAPTAISRLMDIGVKPYLIATSLLMVGAQRLVRKLCQHCKLAYDATDKEMQEFRLTTRKVYKAKGCKNCREIGYWGRVAIYEIMTIDEKLRGAIARGEELGVIRSISKENGLLTLFDSGMRKVEHGVTSIDEVVSIAYE